MRKYILLLTSVMFILRLDGMQDIQHAESIQQKNLLHKICCIFLGTKTASEEVQSCFNEARNNFNIAEDKKLPIKLINKCPVLNNFSSFTWFGTWVNQNDWQRMSDMEKEWAAHHEVAHQKLNHPIKQIMAATSTFFGSAFCLYFFKFHPISAVVVTGALLGLVSSGCSHMYERQADILAAIVLREKNKDNVVDEHIQSLSHGSNEWSMWFNSPGDQIAYLQAIKKCVVQ